MGDDVEVFRTAIEGKDEWFLKQVLSLADPGTELESLLTADVKPFEPIKTEIPED